MTVERRREGEKRVEKKTVLIHEETKLLIQKKPFGHDLNEVIDNEYQNWIRFKMSNTNVIVLNL